MLLDMKRLVLGKSGLLGGESDRHVSHLVRPSAMDKN